MAHINYLIDFTAEVFIVNNGRVLLRKHDKHNIWLSVGGHIELNEDPNEAAIREVKEEVGLDVELVPTTEILEIEKDRYKHVIPPAYMNRHTVKGDHEHVTMIYFARSNSIEIKQGENEISEECKWFTSEEVDQITEDISDTVKHYAKKALEVVEGEKLS